MPLNEIPRKIAADSVSCEASLHLKRQWNWKLRRRLECEIKRLLKRRRNPQAFRSVCGRGVFCVQTDLRGKEVSCRREAETADPEERWPLTYTAFTPEYVFF